MYGCVLSAEFLHIKLNWTSTAVIQNWVSELSCTADCDRIGHIQISSFKMA